MLTTLVAAAALAAGYDPVSDIPVHKTPGPAFQIPCKVDGIKAVESVQLFVSDNRGKTWTLYEEITPDKAAFTFLARKPGEYWFTARLKKKDGTLDPADTANFAVMQRVAVETGTGYEPPPPAPTKPAPTKRSPAAVADELDAELIQLELDLIRKEIKRLSESKEFTRETEDKIDRLHQRLSEIRMRLRRDDKPGTTLPGSTLPLLPSSPDDSRIPPAVVPADPFAIIPVAPVQTPPVLIPMVRPTAPPVAPMPRVPATRY
jgi:hypothetical protein